MIKTILKYIVKAIVFALCMIGAIVVSYLFVDWAFPCVEECEPLADFFAFLLLGSFLSLLCIYMSNDAINKTFDKAH